ncbi:transglutaminase family protein [Moraxella canis]|uniref:transglutaminase family protein n=1 Tax=Moraxella canis TaxID=90239 RepID=UPI000664D883|nr:transglutaminase family protein [Moraxella canis]
MRLQITHQTNYFYHDLAQRSVQYIRMTPLSLAHQTIEYWQVMLPKVAKSQVDGFGNQWLVLSRSEPHDNLQMQASGVVNINPDTPYLADDPKVPYLLYTVPTPLTACSAAMRQFYENHLTDYHHSDSSTKRALLEQFAAALLHHVPYYQNVTHVGTTAPEAFELAQGVCQDHSHIFIACLRDLQIPARYISGYLYEPMGQHMASHAWAEAWIDGHWYTFDVSNQHFTPQAHVYVAIGRDYLDAAPVRGVRLGGGYENLHSQVWIHQLNDEVAQSQS